MSAGSTVLVTGASGFVGSWVVYYALQTGAKVRGTMRNPADPARAKLVDALMALPGARERLELVALDLESAEEDFERAARGVTHVAHVAAHIPLKPVAKRDEERTLVKPAVDAMRKLLRASAAAGTVRTVVLCGALYTMLDEQTGRASEACFSPPEARDAYARSKILVERAGREYMKEHRPAWAFVVLNPYLIVGPSLVPEVRSSMNLVQRLLNGGMPMLPRLNYGVVDVRDVAEAHVLAMQSPEACAGRRFALCKENMWLADMSASLRGSMGARGYKLPSTVAPNFLLRLAALFDGQLGITIKDLDQVKDVDAAPSRSVMHALYARELGQTLQEAGESLVFWGLVKKTALYGSGWEPPREA